MPSTAPKSCIEVYGVAVVYGSAVTITLTMLLGLWWCFFNKKGAETRIVGAAQQAAAMRRNTPTADLQVATLLPTVADGNTGQYEDRKFTSGRERAKLIRQEDHCRPREELARRTAVIRGITSHTTRLDSLTQFSLLEKKEEPFVHAISSDSEDAEYDDETFGLEAHTLDAKASSVPWEKHDTSPKRLIDNVQEKEARSPDTFLLEGSCPKSTSSKGVRLPLAAKERILGFVAGKEGGAEDEAWIFSASESEEEGNDQSGEEENTLGEMLVTLVDNAPEESQVNDTLERTTDGVAEDKCEEVKMSAGDGNGQISTEETLPDLAKEVRDWRPGVIRELFIANLTRGGFRNKATVAKTALGRRSQEPPFVKLEILGVGKFGTVACVRHKLFGVEYALKTLAEGAHGQSKFCAVVEMLVLARLALRPHDNIIAAEAMDDSHPMMPLLLPKAKDDFFSLIESGNYSIKDQFRLIVDVARGALHMHSMGLVHKDIKPENVLIFNDIRLGAHAKLVDFGFTREAGVECPGIMGTPGYLPLECLVSENVTCDASQDVFAVAVLLLLVCVKSPMMRSNMFCHEALYTEEERMKRDHLERQSRNAYVSAEIAAFEMEVTKRTMTDRSFDENILVRDMMDGALRGQEEVCKRLPFFLTAERSKRQDMASLREFVKSLEERQLSVI